MATSDTIDEIDSKILFNLLKDGRKSFSEIAQECNVSTSAICSRFNAMQKAGIILGSTIQMDYKSFGYEAVGTISIQVDPKQIDEVSDYIRYIPNIYSVNPDRANCKIKIVSTLTSLNELDNVKDKIRKHPSVLNFRTSIWTDILNVPENLSQINKNTKYLEEIGTALNSEKNQIKVDETDWKLVKKLGINSRAPFQQIAKDIETSTDTAIRRYKKLTQNGLIKSTIQINPEKLGYFAYGQFILSFSSQNRTPVILETLKKIPDLVLILKVSGNYDLSVSIMIKNLNQLVTTQEQIGEILGITKLESYIKKPYCPWPGPLQYISTM